MSVDRQGSFRIYQFETYQIKFSGQHAKIYQNINK